MAAGQFPISGRNRKFAVSKFLQKICVEECDESGAENRQEIKKERKFQGERVVGSGRKSC
jgi:hypothetical protein